MALAAHPAAARDLSVVSRSPILGPSFAATVLTPFSASTGIPAVLLGWPGGLTVLRDKIASGANNWDLVMVDGQELLPGCDEGLFEKLNWAAVGGKDHYVPAAVSDCGVGAAFTSLVLAWDRDKFQATPGWADFWDVARYPGKRGLRRGPRGNLELALIADGVPPADIYRLLRTDDGLDRAFRKLDQIKPYVAWYDPGRQAAQLLGSGDVLMTSADSPSIMVANRADQHHFGVQWQGCLTSVLSWVVMKGSANAPEAVQVLAFAADPARQAALSAASAFGAVVKGANDLLAPDQQAASPSANLAGGLALDEAFWRDNGDKLTQRFEAWLSH